MADVDTAAKPAAQLPRTSFRQRRAADTVQVWWAAGPGLRDGCGELAPEPFEKGETSADRTLAEGREPEQQSPSPVLGGTIGRQRPDEAEAAFYATLEASPMAA